MSQHLTFSCIVIFIFQLKIPYLSSKNQVKEIVTNLQELSAQNITEILLYGSPRITKIQNCIILNLSSILLWIRKDILALYFSVEPFAFIKNMT